MNKDNLIDLLLETATLKRLPRTGWALRGVPHIESVAEHSFGVAFVALALADLLQDEGLDLEKVLTMAILHDLAEVRLTDLPAPAARLIPASVKSDAEAAAISELLSPLPSGARLQALWLEFEDQASPEGRFIRDCDKLEMMVQCLRYEQAGSRGLDEYWESMDRREWQYSLCGELYARLKAKRAGS